MNWLHLFNKKREPDMQFLDISGEAQQNFPIRLAKNEPLNCTDKQKETYGKMKFHLCPGIIDYARYGFIVPAWDTLKIKGNRAGTIVYQYRSGGGSNGETRDISPMDHALIDGVFEFNNVKENAYKFDSPWKIKCSKNISALLLPAFYHSKFLDDIYTVPGIVDYKSFNTMNWIFSIKRECEITIQAGDPLIHVIPFYNKEIDASYGLADVDTLIGNMSTKYRMFKHFYRKNDSVTKKCSVNKII